MSLHIFASIVGMLMVLMVIRGIFDPRWYMDLVEGLVNSVGAMITLGWLLLLIGLMVLTTEYRVTMDWQGFVVLTAWLTALKGLTFSWFPKQLKGMVAPFVKNTGMMYLASVGGLAWGAALLYYGWMM